MVHYLYNNTDIYLQFHVTKAHKPQLIQLIRIFNYMSLLGILLFRFFFFFLLIGRKHLFKSRYTL